MDLENVYYLFNIIFPIITAIGIVLSFSISIKTLKEIRKDRVLAQKPYLVFKQGGMRDKAVFEKAGKSSPGFNPKAIKDIFADIPDEAISIRREFIKDGKIRLFGEVENYGNGTAFNIKLTWVPKIVWINDEKFIIDDIKKNESKYSEIFNTRALDKEILKPQQTTGILHWPMFIEKDYNLAITRVEGYFKLSYEDSLNNKYFTYQMFHLFTYYKEEPPLIHVTFCDTFADPIVLNMNF